MSEWQNIPDDITKYCGFVYLIRRKDDKYAYIGSKMFRNAIRRKPLKGYKRVRKDTVESDWKKYWSSNTFLQDRVKKLGEDKFERIILLPCKTKAMMSYFELYFQMKYRVLFSDYYLNGIVNVRLGSNAFKNDRKECIDILDDLDAL